MSNKFEKLSIYDVDFKMKDEEGVEHSFTFKPLPFGKYPEIYEVIGKISEVDFQEGKEAFKQLDRDLMSGLMSIELDMITHSYPEMDKRQAEKFVSSNVFELIEPLMDLTFKKEKGSPRKMEQAQKK